MDVKRRLTYGNSIFPNYNHHGGFFKNKTKLPNPKIWSFIYQIDVKLRRALIIVTIFISFYIYYSSKSKYSMSLSTEERFEQFRKYAQHEATNAWLFLSSQESTSFFTSLFCGIGISLFTWMIVYFDSNVPGLDPPSPISLRTSSSYKSRKTPLLHPGYMVAIASGFVVTSLILFG